MSKTHIQIHWIYLITGFGLLFMGSLEYLLSRPPGSTHLSILFPGLAEYFAFRINLFGIFGGVVPGFIHPLAFSLLTMALFPQAQRYTRIWICISWLLIDMLFEIGQHTHVQMDRLLTGMFPHGRILHLLTGYFSGGTYDPLDILAIFLGSLTAFMISESHKKGGVA